jgi:hypothetical protein
MQLSGLPFQANIYANGMLDMNSNNTDVMNPHMRVNTETSTLYAFKENDNGLQQGECDYAHMIIHVTYTTA